MARQSPDSRKVGDSLRYVDAAWQLVGSVGLCALGGYYADKHFHTTPWLLVAGSVLGIVAGMYSLFRAVLSMDAARKSEKDKDGTH